MIRTIFSGILFLAAALIVYTLWKMTHTKGAKKRGHSNINSDQKRVLHQAKVLWSQGDFFGASNLLESINLHTEAAQVLEKSGNSLEAGQLLIRSGHNTKGAALLEKHGHWPEATAAYRDLRFYLKEGHCAQHAGLFSEAALAYSSAEAHLEAGMCYMQANQYSQASASFMVAGEENHWVESIKILAEKAPDQHQFSRSEFSWIVNSFILLANTNHFLQC